MFDQRIEILLKKKVDEVVFIELKEGKTFEYKGAVLDHSIPLPLMVKNIVDKVKGIAESDIHLKNILEGMSFILGIDSEFPYKEQYSSFLRTVDPNIVTSLDILADLAVEEERFLDAIIYLKAAHTLDENNKDIQFRYARCCEWYAKKLEHEPDNEKLLENEAYEVSINMLQENPTDAETMYFIGFHLVNRKSYKAAKEVWERAVEIGLSEDQQGEILENLTKLWSKIQFEEGYLLILDGFPDEGLTKLIPLEEDNPEWWNLMFFIGLAYRQKEDFENAIYYFKKTLNLNTGHIDTFNEIGLCYMSMSLYHESEEYFKEALRLRPNNSEILCNLGIVNLNLGRIEEGKKIIKEAYEADSEDEVTQSWMRYIEQL